MKEELDKLTSFKACLNDKEADKFINEYLDKLPPNWNTRLDMYLAMKNCILEAISYPEKYTIKPKQNEKN